MTPCIMCAATSRSTVIMAMLVLPAPVGAHTRMFSLLHGTAQHGTAQSYICDCNGARAWTLQLCVFVMDQWVCHLSAKACFGR